jgi:alpha-ketoglutarate-dependent 2,4-dichlorophenoxyacetate dioxygenase
MTIQITPLHPLFAAEIGGVDLSRPLDDAAFGRIAEAFNEHSVLVFHRQPLTDEEQIVFSRRFGALEQTTQSIARNEEVAREIADLSNVDPEGKLIPADDRRMLYHSGNQLWHSDSSFKRVPALASLLSAREVPPEGGETEFASLRAAWAALPDATRPRLEEMVAIHHFAYSRSLIAPGLLTPEQEAELPPVRHRLVRVNPVNERKGLYLGSHASHIVDMPVEEGRALLRGLLDFATQPEFVYRHVWRVGDLVMWDNRAVLHRGRPWDTRQHRRVMHRTTVAGDGPTVPDAAPRGTAAISV